jgi:YD repeat-containing protein
MKSVCVSVFIVSVILLNGEVFAQFNLKQNNSNKYFIRNSVPAAKKDGIISKYLLDSTVNKSQDSWNNVTCVYNYDEEGRLSYYDEYSNIAGRTSFYYDSLGNITRITGPASKKTNIYDEHNNNICQLFERPGISQNWVPWMLDSLFYDSSGYLIKERDFYWYAVEWGKTGQTSFYYKNGLLDSVLFEGWVETQWRNNVNCKFYNNEFAAPDSIIWKRWNDTNWVDYLNCTYNYDKAGNLLSGLNEDKTGMLNDYRFNYSYNNNNCFYYGNNEMKLNGSWIPGEYIFYSSRQDIFQPDLLGNVSNFFFNLSFSGTELNVYYKLNPRAATSVSGNNNNNPVQFNLSQNYPNPFNPSTTINYTVAKEGKVKLTVYNLIGSKVAALLDENKPAGNYTVQFDGSNLSSGIYFYRLEAGDYSAVKKLILLK